jgi:hypothetical protein
LSFYAGHLDVETADRTLNIGLQHAAQWMISRIEAMVRAEMRLRKVKRWAWSESFLSDFLSLRELDLLRTRAVE